MLERVVAFFRDYPGAIGGYISGSAARGDADEFSDLDVGVFFADDAARDAAWADRWDWQLGSWFHRFDADHVKPYFVIYLLEPGVKTDLPLYVPTDPTTPGGAPYEVLWDATGDVTRWVEGSNAGREELPPDWRDAVHEDERLWAWTYYCLLHLRRGEYYDVAADFPALRNIVETWHARLGGNAFFDVRRVHEREPDTVERFADLFPRPEREPLKRALLTLLDLHEEQRARVEAEREIEWQTLSATRERMRRWVEEL